MSSSEETRPLAPGVTLTVRDASTAYGYSNIFHLRLQVSVRWEGQPATYRTVLEKMGVYAEDLAAAREALLAGFTRRVTPYLRRPDFVGRLEQQQRARQQRAALKVVGYQ